MVVVATALGVGWFWHITDVPVTDALTFTLGWVWTILLPGWLLHRMVAGKPGDFMTDIAMGAGYGLVASTFVWLLVVPVGLQPAYLFWPLLPLIASLSMRRRVYDFRRFARHAHPLTVAAYALALITLVGAFARDVMGRSQFPPSPNGWYHDTYWHMGLVWEMGRAVPPLDPQIATGEPFWYHWFANAHIAAQAYAGGVDPILALVRLWQPFIYVLVLALILVGARELTGRLWPGAIAGLLTAGGTGIVFSWFGLFGLSAFNVNSPSQQYSLVPILLCLIGGIQLLMTNRRLLPLVTFSLGALGCMGSKGSALPVIICGIGLAMVVAWFLDRARAWWIAAMVSVALVTFGVSLLLTATANAGTSVQLFSTIRASYPWRTLMGGNPVSLEPVIPGLELAGAIPLLMLLLISYMVMFGATWLGLPLLRRNLTAWYLFGVGLAGFAAMQLINQDGLSQVYFMSGALPAWLLLAAAGTHAAWQQACIIVPRATALLIAALGATLGWLLAQLSRFVGGTPDSQTLNVSIASALGVFSLGFAIIVGASLLWDRRLAWLTAASVLVGAQMPWWQILGLAADYEETPTVGIIMAVLIGAALAFAVLGSKLVPVAAVPLAVLGLLIATTSVLTGSYTATLAAAEKAQGKTFVTSLESEAALWVQDHLPGDSLLATNVHCSVAPNTVDCDSRGFWPAGLSGHRMLIGAWAYTPAAHESHGVDGLPSARQPFEDQELLAVNQAAFENPTPEVLDQLRAEGVDFLLGGYRYGEVDPILDELATELFRNEDVVIYSIKPRS